MLFLLGPFDFQSTVKLLGLLQVIMVRQIIVSLLHKYYSRFLTHTNKIYIKTQRFAKKVSKNFRETQLRASLAEASFS